MHTKGDSSIGVYFFCFTMGKVHELGEGGGHSQICKVRFVCCLVLGPLFWECPSTLGVYNKNVFFFHAYRVLL